MIFNRREFVALAGVAAAVKRSSDRALSADGVKTKIKAVAFDGFPIIDPRPVYAKLEEIFPGKGSEFANSWRTRQFEYTWLRTLGGRYAPVEELGAMPDGIGSGLGDLARFALA
jgi:2-haloacid dehalogenase